jgi:predicted amidohydrolase YtcJ
VRRRKGAIIAETAVVNGRVITMTQEGAGGCAQALAIEQERIVAVGTDREIEPLIGPGTRVLDLAGKTILPGFIDSHVHLTATGLGAVCPSIYDVVTSETVLDFIAGVVAKAPHGEPVMIYGARLGEFDKPFAREQYDRIAPRNPLFVSDLGAHACAVNTLAWRELGLPVGTPGVQCDPLTSQPTGVLVGPANTLARFHFLNRVDDAVRVAALHEAARMALRKGITTVHALEGGTGDGHGWQVERDVHVLLQEQNRLPLRTVIYFQTTEVQRVQELGLRRIGGCLYVDGAYGEHTAALLEPYADNPSTSGMLYFTDEELYGFVSRAHKAGLQISMHAIGDAAIEQLLGAYEQALLDDPRVNHRHRIEHFSLPTRQHIEKAARLGVAVAMQPNFAYVPPQGQDDTQIAALAMLGPARYRHRHPYRTILTAGVLVAGGSDSDAKPFGPLFGIHALVNHPDEERRLSVYEALSLYTVNAAWIAHEEKDKGTIEPGKLADLVVLDEDPLTACPARLQDIPVSMTIVGGKVVDSLAQVPAELCSSLIL